MQAVYLHISYPEDSWRHVNSAHHLAARYAWIYHACPDGITATQFKMEIYSSVLLTIFSIGACLH